MDTPLQTADFRDFSRLLNALRVEYLLVGGYAVGLHGYPRATVDLDVWIRATRENAAHVLDALREFGFDVPSLNEQLFTNPRSVVRFGVPPFRIELMTSIDGVEMSHPNRRCHAHGTGVTAGASCASPLRDERTAPDVRPET
jgi:hypothetical protein